MSPRAVHALGPKGWYTAPGTSTSALHGALFASGAIRQIPRNAARSIEKVYADPLRNRTFAFLDAAFGPMVALSIEASLKRSTVGIVGCGGIGSAMAYLLAGMGVRKFVFIDPDVVEEGNLVRQMMYTLDSINKPKTYMLSKALKARFRELEITTQPKEALNRESLRQLSRCDHVICTGDDPPTLSGNLCRKLPNSIPLWACGYALGRSIVRGPEVTKRSTREPVVDWQSIPSGFAPSSGLQNLEIAATCVWQIVLYFSGIPRAKNFASHTSYLYDYTEWRRLRQ